MVDKRYNICEVQRQNLGTLILEGIMRCLLVVQGALGVSIDEIHNFSVDRR